MGVKIEKYQASEIAILHSLQFYIYWRFFFLRCTSCPYILKAFKHLPFYLKLQNKTSPKCHFLKKILTNFSEHLVGNVKSMPDAVLKVTCRCLLSFFSHWVRKVVIFTPVWHRLNFAHDLSSLYWNSEIQLNLFTTVTQGHVKCVSLFKSHGHNVFWRLRKSSIPDVSS